MQEKYIPYDKSLSVAASSNFTIMGRKDWSECVHETKKTCASGGEDEAWSFSWRPTESS